MDVNELKEAIQSYKFFIEELKRLKNSLETKPIDIFDIQINPSRRDAQIRRKMEKVERKTSMLLKAMAEADLTDKEWSVVDFTMEGATQRELADHFGCSHTHIRRYLKSSCEKMESYLNGG